MTAPTTPTTPLARPDPRPASAPRADATPRPQEPRGRTTPRPGLRPESRATPRNSTGPAGPTAQTLERPEPGAVDPLIGQRPLGQYEILSRIGEGGFGAVYLAEQTGVGRKAVIKVLRKTLVDSEVFIKRFEREAAVLAKLDNQHLVRLYNFGELDDGQLFLAMEYGGDATLSQVVRAAGRLEADRALYIAEQVCEALEEAHQHGIVHRDLKPQNILLGRRGTQDWVKVVDVGIAKILDSADLGDSKHATLTRSGAIIGTPAYFSPEQARGLSVDARSDLYAVGVVLYEMLTGQLPISAVSPIDFVRAHAVEPPLPMKTFSADVPAWLEQLVMKALEKNPARRFQTAHELQEALRAARQRIFGAAPSSGSRRAALIGASAAVLAAAVGGILFLRAQTENKQVAVEVATASVSPAAGSATLKLEGLPQGAKVLLDGAKFDPASPEVRAGAHRLRVLADGFVPFEQEIGVSPGVTVVPVALSRLAPATAPSATGPPPAPPAPAKHKSAETITAGLPQPPPATAPAPRSDAQAARLLEEAAQRQQQHDEKGAQASLERVLELAPSPELQARALRQLADLQYRAGNSRLALGLYQRLRPLVSPRDRGSIDERIAVLRDELGQ